MQEIKPQQTSNGQPPKKLSKVALVAIICAALFVLLLTVGVVVASINMANNKKDANTDKNETSKVDDVKQDDSNDSNASPKVAPITATSMIDLRALCAGGSVENAAPYTKPYRFAVFENNNALKQDHDDSSHDRTMWDTYGISSVEEGTSKERDATYKEINGVICLDRDDSTAAKSKTCEFKAEGSPIKIDYYSVKYKVTLYEAQSGNKIDELAPINGTATTCPKGASYDSSDPRIYASPDVSELNDRLAPFEK